MRRAALLVSVLALAVPATARAAKLPSGPTPPLSHDGRWVTDARGRVAIFHGFNMVYKRPPYDPKATGFGRDDAKFLRRQGFNAIRLGIIYKGLEPNPPSYGHTYNAAYLNEIADTQKALAKSGVYSLLDFHQDMYNERFQGEGWPDWAVDDDGLPAEPKNGFPVNYITMPALNHAFDHFWANDSVLGGQGLQDAYAQAWSNVAGRFAGRRYVLGYDLLNEPWPGSVFPTCLNTAGCPAFDQNTLTPFSKRVIAAIRQTDGKTLAFYEPNVLFNFGAATSHGATGDPNTGLSFHVYCIAGLVSGTGGKPCSTLEELPFQNADAQSQRTGDPQLLTEFGATDDLPTLERIADFADEHMTSWMEWHYCACDDPTTSGPGDTQALVIDPSKPPTGDNVKLDKLRVLERPYPQAVAGTPKDWSFDSATHAFQLDYSTKGPQGKRLPRRVKTVVSTPELQYPDGYVVDAEGARRVSAPDAARLKLKRKRGAGEVHLTVTPR